MPTILTKRSSTVGAVPTSSQLIAGETAVNTADAYLYVKHTDGSVKRIGTTADSVHVNSTGIIPEGSLQDVLAAIDAAYLTQTQSDARYILASSVDDTGKVASFMRSTAPAGYIKANGGTIGSVTSGATNRANSDTWPLFHLWWDEFDNSLLHIQDSTGIPTVRGASAAADWAANKRLPTFDRRGNSSRGWDDGRGIDPGRVLGSFQDSAVQAHNHYLPTTTGNPGNDFGLTDGVAWAQSVINEQPVDGYFATTYPRPGYAEGAQVGSIGNFSGETRSANIAELICIKL